MKPRLRRAKIVTGTVTWVCDCGGQLRLIGYGATPKAAYRDWQLKFDLRSRLKDW